MIAEETIDFNIRKSWNNIKKMYNNKASKYTGNASLAMLVLNIDIYEGTPSTRIGPIMGMEPTSISRYLKRLEKMGVIYKKGDKKDKRKSIIHLTEKGLQQRIIARDFVINFNEKIYSQINEEEIDIFFKVLKIINKVSSQKTN